MHSLFRVGKKSCKYDFELSNVEAIHSALERKLVTLRWHRSGKSGGASKNVLATPDGRAIWSSADPVLLAITLYRSDASGPFDAKEFKICIEEVVRAGATKTLATAKIDLAKFADKTGANRSEDCELTLLGDDGLKGRIKLSLTSALQGSNLVVNGNPNSSNSSKQNSSQPTTRHATESAPSKDEATREHGSKDTKSSTRLNSDDSGLSGKGAATASHQPKPDSNAATKRGSSMPSWERSAVSLPDSDKESEESSADDDGNLSESSEEEEAASLEIVSASSLRADKDKRDQDRDKNANLKTPVCLDRERSSKESSKAGVGAGVAGVDSVGRGTGASLVSGARGERESTAARMAAKVAAKTLHLLPSSSLVIYIQYTHII